MLYQLNIGLLRDNPKLIHIAEFISLSRVGGGAVRKVCGFEEVRAFILDQIPGKRRETGGKMQSCGIQRVGEAKKKITVFHLRTEMSPGPKDGAPRISLILVQE